MSSIKVKGDLTMNNNTFEIQETIMKDFFKQNNIEPCAVFLTNAEVGNLFIYGCKFISPKSEFNKLNMKTLKVYGYLQMGNDSEIGEVDLLRAKIEGQIVMSNSEFKGKLNMDSLEVRGDLLMRGNLKFTEVDIHNAVIDGQLQIRDATFTDKLNMNFIKVKNNITIENKLIKEVLLLFAKIGQNLNISKGKFSYLNLAGTQIDGELQLRSEKGQLTQWDKGAIFILCNAEIGAFQDLPDSWPDDLELDGLIYTQLGGFGLNIEDVISSREGEWFIKWLAKQKKYTSQPYEQLAYFLKKSGYTKKASDILYAGRERERNEVATGKYWLWLTILNYLIGYGYGHRLLVFPFFYWVPPLTLLGTIFIYLDKKGQKKRILKEQIRCIIWCLFYSLDILLPIFKLDEQHKKIKLEGCAKYYFYFHKAIGFILASFIIAGISGLTK